jgi:hypothetical protein
MKTICYFLIATTMLSSCKTLKSTYKDEVEQEKLVNPIESPQVITESDIAHLPEPVQKYFRYCGFVGQPLVYNCSIEWDDVEFKMKPENEWIPIRCLQFNSVKEPARFAYLYAPKMGINIFVGRDKYQAGKGNMHIRILGLFNIQNVWGREMDESSLVTILSETLFVPGYALQHYISWEPIDSLSARGTITHNGISVSGIFYFNPKGEMTHFISYDRNFVGTDGKAKKVPWVASVDFYTPMGIRTIPAYVRATWKLPEGDYEYFRGKVVALHFNQSKN